MARRNLIICDRCEREIRNRAGVHVITDGFVRNGEKELCGECYAAFKLFMNNEDQVGEYVFVLGDGDCPHHVPCASPCTREWKQVHRSEA
jgi:hypothetical protein